MKMNQNFQSTTIINQTFQKSNQTKGKKENKGFGNPPSDHPQPEKVKTTEDHHAEWRSSWINDSMIEANLRSILPDPIWGEHWEEPELPEAYYILNPFAQCDFNRKNDGRISTSELKKIDQPHLTNGGWMGQGFDIHTGEKDWFVCYKPNSPRWDYKKGDYIKYEHPYNCHTKPFYPAIPFCEANNIAFRAGAKTFEKWEKFRDSYQGDPEFAIWEFAKSEKSLELHITEGYKKAASLIVQGYLTLAFSGVWNWIDSQAENYLDQKGRKKRFKTLTKDLTPLLGERNVFIWFDEDPKPKTQQNVKTATKILGKQISKTKSKIWICNWNYEDGKGIDDAIAKNGVDWLNQTYNNARSLSNWLYQNRIKINVDKIINKPFLEKGDFNAAVKLFGIKSEKGTGKTEALNQYIQDYIKAGIRVLVIPHREQLTRNLGNRFGLDTIYDIHLSETKGETGIVCTIDSLHAQSQYSFDIDKLGQDYIVIFDECKQVFDHLLSSKDTTVKDYRPEICSNISDLVANARQVILSDADLTQIELNYVTSMIGSCSRDIIWNQFLPSQGRKLFNYNSSESLLFNLLQQCHNLSEAKKRGENTDGMKILIPTDSQNTKSKYSAQNLKLLIEQKFPNLKGAFMDSETVVDPENQCFHASESIDNLVRSVDFLAYTSVGGTGISIDIEDYIGYVFSFNQGTQSENSTRQFLARLRDKNAELHCFFKKIGVNKKGKGEDTPEQVYQSNLKEFKANISHLNKFNRSQSYEDENNNQMIDHSRFYTQYIADHNLGMSTFREIVLDGLQNKEGFQIINQEDITSKQKKKLNEEITQNKDENYNYQVEQKLQCETPDTKTYETNHQKRELTKQERMEIEKYELQQKYGIELDRELIEENDNGLYPKMSLLFWSTWGTELTKEKDNQKANEYFENNNRNKKGYFISDFNRTQKSRIIQILEGLRIPEMIQELEGKEIHNDSPEIKEWWEYIESMMKKMGRENFIKDIKIFTGLTISEHESKVRQLGKFLDLISYKIENTGKQTTKSKTSDFKRHHIHIIKPRYSKQDQILEKWNAKFNPSNPLNLDQSLIEKIKYFNNPAITLEDKIKKFNELKESCTKSLELLKSIAPYIKDDDLADQCFIPLIQQQEEQEKAQAQEE